MSLPEPSPDEAATILREDASSTEKLITVSSVDLRVLLAEYERLRDVAREHAVGRWQYVPTDEWVSLHRVALQARDAVQVAGAAGVHLGPLRAALDETAYKVPATDRLSEAARLPGRLGHNT